MYGFLKKKKNKLCFSTDTSEQHVINAKCLFLMFLLKLADKCFGPLIIFIFKKCSQTIRLQRNMIVQILK